MNIEDIIKPGSIIYLEVEFQHEEKPRKRYLVVITCDNQPLLLKINTSKHQSSIARKKREFLFKLRKDPHYPFLSYDSYLDCGTVHYNLITKDEIIQQISQDNSIYLGELIPDHMNEVIRLSEKSLSISTRHMRIIRDNFS